MTQPQATPANQASGSDDWDKAAEGLKGINEFVGEIKTATFMTATEAYGKSSDYEENCIIVLECTVEQPIDPPDFEHDTTKIFLSVGRLIHWLILDGGARIQSAKQGGGLANSAYQLFIARVTKELKVPIKDRPDSSPFRAASWVGLRFHFAREGRPIPTQFLKEGGPTESFTMLPKQWMQSEMPPPLAVGA